MNSINNGYQELAYSIVLKAIEDYKEGGKIIKKDAEDFLKSSTCDFYLGDIRQRDLLDSLCIN